MEKKTVLAIVLICLVLGISTFYQMKFVLPGSIEKIEQQKIEENKVAEEAVPDTKVEVVDLPAVETNVAAEEVTIETNVIRARFSSRGGDLISYELLNYKDNGQPIQMVDNLTDTNRAFGIALGRDVNIINEVFNVKKIDDYTVGFYRTISLKDSSGKVSDFILSKKYAFKPDDYLFQLTVHIDGSENFKGLNIDNLAYSLRTSPQIGPRYSQKNNRYESRTFMSLSNGKKKRENLAGGQIKEFEKPFSWTSVAGKYFETIVAPSFTNFEKVFYSMQYGADKEYSDSQLYLARNPITESSCTDIYNIYIGPRTEKFLKLYNNADDNAWGLSGLQLNESMETTSFLTWLEVFLKWLMQLIYDLIHNWGVSIIIVTILIKIALYPLTRKSSISTLKMQEIQPRMQAIQEKYKGNPEKLNVEMAKMYKETGYNPASGCLPILIQIPLLMAVYNLFNNYFEFRGACFIPGWIDDLSVGDSIHTFGFNLPIFGNQLRLLPIIYVVSQLFYNKISQAMNAGAASQNAKSMKIMTYGMSIFFFFIFYNAPAGLLIYWTVQNFMTLFQQVAINRLMAKKKAEMASVKKNLRIPVKNKKKR